MERHLFKFGDSSLALVIPKKWTENSGLGPTSLIYITENEGGDLVLASKEHIKKDSEIIVGAGMSSQVVERWVELHYLYGTSKLRLYSADGNIQKRIEYIEENMNKNCPGFVITSQSDKDIIIEDFMDMKEQSIEKIIGRVRSLIGYEFREFTEGNPKSIAGIEDLVNRFYMLGTRYVFITQPKDALKYFRMLERIEEISDNMNRITADPSPAKKRIIAELKKEFDAGFLGFYGDIKAIERTATLRAEIVNMITKAKLKTFEAFCLYQIADHIANISEFGLRI